MSRPFLQAGRVLAAVLVLCFAAAPARAQITVTGDDARVIAQIAQRVGDTEITYGILNTPLLSIADDIGGEWFTAEFIGCTDGVACQAISLMSDFTDVDLTDGEIGRFNRDHFYVRAYRRYDGMVVVQQDVSLIHGVNDEWLFQTFATFGRLVDIFAVWQADPPAQ